MKDFQLRMIVAVTARVLDRGFRVRYWFARFVHNPPCDGARSAKLNFDILRVFKGQLPP